jgi:hypothetical protein
VIVAESPLTIIALGKINFSDVSVYPNGSYISSGTIDLSDQFKTAFAAYAYSATRPIAGVPYFNVATRSGSNIVLSGQAKGTSPKINYNVRSAGDYTANYPYAQLATSSQFNFTNSHGTTFSILIAPSIYPTDFQITGGFLQFDDTNDQGIKDFIYINTASAVDVAGPTFNVGAIPAATTSYNWSTEFNNNGDNAIQFTTSGNNITTKFPAGGTTGFRPAFKISAMKNTRDNKYAIEKTINFCRWNYQNTQTP